MPAAPILELGDPLANGVAWAGPELRVLACPDPEILGRVIPIPIHTAAGLMIGRSAGADLRILDDSISRRHARITVAGGRTWIEDLGSTWQTKVDGEWIAAPRRTPLLPGSLLQVGRTRFEFRSPLEQILTAAAFGAGHRARVRLRRLRLRPAGLVPLRRSRADGRPAMTQVKEPRSWMARYGDLLLAAAVLAIVALMIVGVPSPVMDAMLAINMAVSVAVLMVALYTAEAVRLPSFPTVLLPATLFRLALNVSSTKLILLEGNAGAVIEAFGQFVVGGNLVVGAIVFLVLVVVQFVVVAKGSERVAEVSARFTLDAMPGKQMAIDADVRAHTITEAEARERRELMDRESKLYGAMDGAMKFVKGDAIAVPIADLGQILGSLARWSMQTKDAETLCEHVRRDLRRTLCGHFAFGRRRLCYVSIDGEIDRRLQRLAQEPLDLAAEEAVRAVIVAACTTTEPGQHPPALVVRAEPGGPGPVLGLPTRPILMSLTTSCSFLHPGGGAAPGCDPPSAVRRRGRGWLLVALAVGVGACKHGGNSTAELRADSVAVIADRLDGGPGTAFLLQARPGVGSADTTIRWDLGDGRSSDGPTITVTYDSPGIREVRASALRNAVEVAAAGVVLTVFDPTPTEFAGSGVPVPPLLGDVDGNGVLDAADVHRIGKDGGGLESLSLAARRAGDYDIDGDVDVRDAQLLAQAVVGGGVLPSALDPVVGTPFTQVRIQSRFLLDVFARVEVRVGAAPPRPVRRTHPGYGQFLVPSDVVALPAFTPVTEGPIQIGLLVDGTEVESFAFALRNPPPVVGDEMALLASALGDLDGVFTMIAEAMGPAMDEVGAVPTERAVFQTLMDYSRSEFRTASESWSRLMPSVAGGEGAALGYLLNAGGLRAAATAAARLASETRTLASQLPQSGGVTLLRLLCTAGEAANIAEKVDTALSLACAAAAAGAVVSGFFNGPIGPVVAAGILAISRGLSVASDVFVVLKEVLPKPSKLLAVTAERIAGSGPAAFRLRVGAQLKPGLLCGAPAGIAISEIQDLILRRLATRQTSWLSFGFIQNFPFFARDGVLRKRIVDAISGSITSITGAVLDAVGITDQIAALKNKWCSRLVGQSSIGVRIDELRTLEYTPTANGTLVLPQPGSDDPALFVAAPQLTGNGKVIVVATLEICGEFWGGFTELDLRGVNVQFCQGDNGSLLDDIFELRVDGVVLLAPSVPVVNVCGSLELTPGDHTVVMIGRAAPDLIGTYFLSASPGQLIGPPLSGSNLLAGTQLSWTLRITAP